MHGCVGGTVAQNGKVNENFGVYKSVCCGAEIVITKGAIFPYCPDHARLTTMWKLLADEDMTQLTDKKESKPKRAA
jgi:hypothetical protein